MVKSAISAAAHLPRLASLGRSARLRETFDAAAHLFGFAEPRADRAPAELTIRLGAADDPVLAVTDWREGAPRTYRFEAAAEDLAERLAAICGGRGGGRAKIVIDPAACFTRSLVLPAAALPRMRAVLAQELEATTPFRAGAVYSDWYVEGEDGTARTLLVRHVVLKRARLDPLLAVLAGAGLVAGPVAVGRDEGQTMPVDLLSDGHRALPPLLAGARRGDLALMLGAFLLIVAAYAGLRQNQEATLAALDAAFGTARRALGPPAPPPVQAGTAAILSGRLPALARTWDAVAAALPDSASATGLRLDGEGVLLTLAAADEAGILAALEGVPGFGRPALRESAAGADGLRRLVVLLPRAAAGGRP